MKVLPVASKADIVQPQSNEMSAKARAVAAFKSASAPPPQAAAQPKAATQHPAALDQNSLHAEDLGSLQVPKPNIQPDSADSQTLIEESAVETADTPQDPPPVDPALSRQFAQLARQEKALRAKVQQQDQQLKAREAALAAREAAIAQQAQAPSVDLSKYIPKDRLMQDPITALAEAGMPYEQLTERALSRVPVDPMVQAKMDAMEARLANYEKAIEDGKKQQTDAQQTQYEAAVKQITLDAKALVKSDPVAFEAIHKTGTVKDVVRLIEETYKKDGVLLTVEEAAQEVENYLVEENFQMATKIDKIRNRLGKVAPPQASTQQRPANNAQPQMKTLTNATASSRPLSARERALLAFEGKLK